MSTRYSTSGRAVKCVQSNFIFDDARSSLLKRVMESVLSLSSESQPVNDTI